MIKRAICKAKRIDVQKEKKMSKIRMRRIPSGLEGANDRLGGPGRPAFLLAAINASSFKASRDPHKERREQAARQSYGKQKHG